MKVLFYFGGFAPVGGIETFCKNLLCYLQANQWSCQLVCWGQNSSLLNLLQQAGIRVIRIPFRWGCRWHLPDWLLLSQGLQQVNQADIVIFGKLLPLAILNQLKSKAKNSRKFVYITPYEPSVPTSSAKKNTLSKTLDLFDLILVQSSSFVYNLHQIGYQGQVEVVPYIPQESINLEDFPSQDQLKIGFLGRLVEDKNVDLLLESFKCFQEKYSNVSTSNGEENRQKPTLHLFGDGNQRELLEELVRNLGIADSVRFHGSVPNNQVEDAIASCHLFVFTSHVEGQCLAALEILGCGRPLVATSVGALPDILSDKRLGRLVSSGAAEDIADSLIEMTTLFVQNQISPESIRSAYLERYASGNIGDRYVELLRRLCNIST
jgi:glycosyltransferase involved in cell wall biosynthesis